MNNLHTISESHRPLRGTTLDLISQGSKHCLVLDTPFHLAHTDIPFDQVHYFSNLDTIYPDAWQDILDRKTKLIFMFTDWWHTVNVNETHNQPSGNLISLDLYKICYELCKRYSILDNSSFISPSSIQYVEQFDDWPIVNYNEPFNRYFEFSRDIEVLYNTTPMRKHFLWLNRRSREHRMYAQHQAYKMDLFDNCIYSLHDLENWSDQEFTKFLSEYLDPKDIDLTFRKLKKRLDHGYSAVTDKQHLSEITDLKYYSEQTYLDIVGEFNCSNHKVFLTEKVSRSIVLGKPFVVFGDRGSLHELRSLGFRTFGDFWDERYDKLSTSKQRIDAALETLDWIRNNIDITQGYSNDMIEILEYNRKHYNTIWMQSQLELFKKIL